MKKVSLILFVCLVITASCSREWSNGAVCISADKTNLAPNEMITISNCGDELPSQYVTTSLDWGDGTITDGQTGTHNYSVAGSYDIRLLLNGEYAANVTDVEESSVKITIIIN